MIELSYGDALDIYPTWPSPHTIISDGPYGVGGYPGDPKKPDDLPTIYEPHIQAWAKAATPQTTLWFWCTEIGWAITHSTLAKHGWKYRGCNAWELTVSQITTKTYQSIHFSS